MKKLLIAAGAVTLGAAATALLIWKASQLAQGAGFAIAVEDPTDEKCRCLGGTAECSDELLPPPEGETEEEGYSFTQPAYPSAADGTRVVDPVTLGDPLKYTRRPSGGRRLTDESGLTLEDDD